MHPAEVHLRIGDEPFHELTRKFYEGVATDPILRPMYPEGDLEPARRRLALFLIQFFGGPPNYSLQRGHPRLRMRHLPFAIDQAARDTWVKNMLAALDSLDLDPNVDATMRKYFEDAATFLMNKE